MTWRSVACAGLRRLAGLVRDESGAALVITLSCFMFMYAMCMGVYTVGTAVRERIQLQNAADAAAYSAAVIQADTISRIATINRAMAWTYVQMTRRQMDYIVASWLNRSYKIFKEDEAYARKWNHYSIMIPSHPCQLVHKSPIPTGDTYWCGIDESHDGIGKIWVNGLSPAFDEVPIVGNVSKTIRQIPFVKSLGFGRALDIDDIDPNAIDSKLRSFLQTYSRTTVPLSGDYISAVAAADVIGTQIQLDKANIKAMNLAELQLAHKLHDRIEKAIPDILRANLPERDVDSDRIVYRIEQAPDHLVYFRYLHNTRHDEKYFYSFAGYDDEPYKVMRGGDKWSLQGLVTDPSGSAENLVMEYLEKFTGDKFVAVSGTDRWFVRGNGERRAKDSDIGIQRCYKHWAEDVLKSLHPAKYVRLQVGGKSVFLPATCLNFNTDENDPSNIARYMGYSLGLNSGKKENGKYTYTGLPSIGLYSEWQWYSMLWFCYRVYIPFPPWHYDVHKSVAPPIMPCKHNSWELKIKGAGKNCIYLPGRVLPCWYKSYHLKRKKWGGLSIKSRLHQSAGGMTTDFGIPGFRGYTRVYGDDPSIYNSTYYVGERCLPLLINQLYFGELGTISVGVARRNENVWTRLTDTAGGIVKRGIFEAFEPFVKWSWAFSSAKAGYNEPGSDGSAYIIDWKGGDQRSWNLCQPDWDAVFVPVARAKSLAYSSLWLGAEDISGGSPGFLRDWMNDDVRTEWKPLAENGSKLPKNVWREVKPPPGMDGKPSDLDWSGLPANFFH